MQEIIKEFSINDAQFYRDEEDLDFSTIELWSLAEGNNSHRNPISREVLEECAHTFKGKLIVAKFDKYKKDVRGHETDEIIVGYVDPREEIEFKTKIVDGIEKEFVVVKGLISKIYANEIIDMFHSDNQRAVSCEFTCSTMYEEDFNGHAHDKYGEIVDNPITKYHILGITLLGKDINPSVRGAEAKIKKFAEEYATEIEAKTLAEQLMKFATKLNQTSNDDDYIVTDNKEDIMEENKQLSEPTEDKEKDVVMEEVKEEEKELSESEEETKEDVQEDKEMSEVEKEDDKEMSCETDSETDKELSEVVEEEKEEKKFSFAEFITVDLSTEDEAIKNFAESTFNMNADEIVNTIVTLAKENFELKKFQEERLSIERDNKLNSIMASVKEDLDSKKFSELQEEGKTLSLAELGGFENKVKAFAYEATKDKKKPQESEDEIMKFAGKETNIKSDNLSADEIFKKYE